MNKKPTEEQLKEFWEWCGLYQDSFGNDDSSRPYSGIIFGYMEGNSC
jgi:hypothetical protein